MEQIKNILKQRQQQLWSLKEEKEKALIGAPSGHLRISSSDKRVQLYHKDGADNTGGRYLCVKDREFARRLAQKDYDKKILLAVNQELRAIEKYMTAYPDNAAETIIEQLHPERQKLVTPIVETEREFVHNWESEEYEALGFSEETPDFYTTKGERVRSKSELIIADMLNKKGIPYRYEYPLYLKGYGTIYPDFTVLNIRKRKEIRYEHFGRMDDPAYAERTIQKLHTYNKHGFYLGDNLIATFETRKNPLSQKELQNLIHQYLK